MKSYSDQTELIEACKRGDRRAQYTLYEKYCAAMYNVSLRMMRNPVDAEDSLQNAFVDVFSKLGSYRYEATIGAWIKRIVINNCINSLKKRRLAVQEWDERIPEPPVEEASYGAEDARMTVQRVKDAMMQLPDGYRTVFSLYCLEGYDHKEIGQIMQISEATSKSQYSRAKRKLRSLMHEDEVGRGA